LQLKPDESLLSFAFEFNLRQYIVVLHAACQRVLLAHFGSYQAGAYTRPLFGTT
jgi:hypothetical protein